MTVAELISLLHMYDRNLQVKTCSSCLWGGTILNSLEPGGVNLVDAVNSGDGELMIDESRSHSKDGWVFRLNGAIDRGEPVLVLCLK
jgi:hypothetical protein